METTVANQNPDPVKVIARTAECMRRFMEAGLTYDDLQKPIDDPKMRERLVKVWANDGYDEFVLRLMQTGLMQTDLQKVLADQSIVERTVRFLKHGGFEPSTSQKRAAEIMGRNLFGIEHAIKYFKVTPTKGQMLDLAEIPFSETTLGLCKDTHVLVAVFPISFLDLVKMPDFFPYGDSFVRDHRDLALKPATLGWHLVRKGGQPNTTRREWKYSLHMLETNKERVPEAIVVAYTFIGHCLATGEKALKDE